MRVAIYLRVSTDKQTTENQRPECEQLAQQRGQVVARYEESGSATKKRPAFERMLRDARRGAFDVLVIWAIDRFGRSMVGNLGDITELDRVGVRVVSVRESWLDTSGPTRGLLIAIFSWAAEQERARLVERTKAGLATARRKGVRLGRPPRVIDIAAVARLRGSGLSLRAVAKAMDLPFSTVQSQVARTRQ